MRIFISILCACFLPGCVKRTTSITSAPSGALVWVNDREVGRTPVDVDFLYYGEYDVRVEKDGQEPIMTTKWARSTSWDLPVLDIVVESVSDQETVIEWHFDLVKRNDNPELLLLRAHELRASTMLGSND